MKLINKKLNNFLVSELLIATIVVALISCVILAVDCTAPDLTVKPPGYFLIERQKMRDSALSSTNQMAQNHFWPLVHSETATAASPDDFDDRPAGLSPPTNRSSASALPSRFQYMAMNVGQDTGEQHEESRSLLRELISGTNLRPTTDRLKPAKAHRWLVHGSATTTARPIYDQIPRPTLFEKSGGDEMEVSLSAEDSILY